MEDAAPTIEGVPEHVQQSIHHLLSTVRSIKKFAHAQKRMTATEVQAASVRLTALVKSAESAAGNLTQFITDEATVSAQQVHALNSQLLSSQGAAQPDLFTMRFLYNALGTVSSLCAASCGVLLLPRTGAIASTATKADLVPAALVHLEDGTKAHSSGLPSEVMALAFSVWTTGVAVNICTQPGTPNRQFKTMMAFGLPPRQPGEGNARGVVVLLDKVRDKTLPKMQDKRILFTVEDEHRGRHAAESIGHIIRTMPLSVTPEGMFPLAPSSYSQEYRQWTGGDVVAPVYPLSSVPDKQFIYRAEHGPSTVAAANHRRRTVVEPAEVLTDVLQHNRALEIALEVAHTRFQDAAKDLATLEKQLKEAHELRLKAEAASLESSSSHRQGLRRVLGSAEASRSTRTLVSQPEPAHMQQEYDEIYSGMSTPSLDIGVEIMKDAEIDRQHLRALVPAKPQTVSTSVVSRLYPKRPQPWNTKRTVMRGGAAPLL